MARPVSSPRGLLKDTWEHMSELERAEMFALGLEMWRASLGATKGRKVKGTYECPGCGKQNLVEQEVEVEDITTRAKAFALLADQGYGRPQESVLVTHEAGERTLEALRALPLQELAALVGSEWGAVEEGEWAELPPAA